MIGEVYSKDTGQKVTYKQFFNALGYEDNDNIFIRVFYEDQADIKQHGKNYNPLSAKYNRTCKLKEFNNIIDRYLIAQNSNGYGIFYSVNGGHNDTDTKANNQPRAQFMEVDDKPINEQLEIISKFAVQPSMIIKTKKSLHCYWLLNKGATWEEWQEIQERLIQYFNSDPAIKNASRVLRLPGFLHNKNKNEPIICELLKFDTGKRYDQAELLAELPPVKKKQSNKPKRQEEQTNQEQTSQQYTASTNKATRELEAFLQRHDIETVKDLYTIKNSGEEVTAYYLQSDAPIPWRSEYTTPWKENDSLFFIRDNGLICFDGRHQTDKNRSAKDFITYYEPGFYMNLDNIQKGWEEHKQAIEQNKGIDLKTNSKGVIQSIDNALKVFEQDQAITNVFKYNEFNECIFMVEPAPWINKKMADSGRPIKDIDYDFLSKYMEQYGLKSESNIIKALNIYAAQNSYNPLTDLLDSLEYVPGDNIRPLLQYIGADNTNYNYEVLKLAMYGAVARAYEPGIKYDYMPIIQGKQGMGKSTFINKLAMYDEYFTDNMPVMKTGKDAGEQMQGKWIIECGELASMYPSEVAVLKAFITSRVDRYRKAYGKTVQDRPRKCVFWGSTNDSTYLKDTTGNRRFLPINCEFDNATKSIFSDEAEADIKKAWAEVVHLYKSKKEAGERISLVLPQYVQLDALEHQAEAMEVDEWESLIHRHLKDAVARAVREAVVHQSKYITAYTSALDIYILALDGEAKNCTKQISKRINAILDKLDKWQKATTVRTEYTPKGRGYKYSASIEEAINYADMKEETRETIQADNVRAFKQPQREQQSNFATM